MTSLGISGPPPDSRGRIRNANGPQDALAADFCAPGVWAKARPQLPEALRQIEEKEHNRIGREIVHLTYYRLGIGADEKIWDLGELARVIADVHALFSEVADPELLTEESREALSAMPAFFQQDERLLILQNLSGPTSASQMIHPPGSSEGPSHSPATAQTQSPRKMSPEQTGLASWQQLPRRPAVRAGRLRACS